MRKRVEAGWVTELSQGHGGGGLLGGPQQASAHTAFQLQSVLEK